LKYCIFVEVDDVWVTGRTKQNFQYKAKTPEHDTIVKRGFRVDHEKDLNVLICKKPVLYVFALEPGLLIKPADGCHDRQKEQTEHEIGLRAQPLVQKMADVKEQER